MVLTCALWLRLGKLFLHFLNSLLEIFVLVGLCISEPAFQFCLYLCWLVCIERLCCLWLLRQYPLDMSFERSIGRAYRRAADPLSSRSCARHQHPDNGRNCFVHSFRSPALAAEMPASAQQVCLNFTECVAHLAQADWASGPVAQSFDGPVHWRP